MTAAAWEDLQIGDHIVHTKSKWEWVILDARVQNGVRQIKLRSLFSNPPVLEINGPGPSGYSIWLDLRSASLFEEVKPTDMLSIEEVFQEIMDPIDTGVSAR